MSNLSVKYLGLDLKSPVIVGSSGLTDSSEKIKKLADYGAGAVVLKSLFEEQIKYEAGSMIMDGQYPEAEDYLMTYLRSNNIEAYLKLIEESKNSVDIPIIASVNCVSNGEWISFAKQAEEAGADALELNLYILPLDVTKSSEKYEKLYSDIIADVKKEISIPVAVKLGQNFSNIPGLVKDLYNRGAGAVVLFNRFYAPDINIDKIEFTPADVLSSPQEIRNTLRWVGIISSLNNQVEVCASTGVHDSASVVKMLLAGAQTVQVCSALYKNGPKYLETMLNEIKVWMDKNTFDSIDNFRGRLNYKRIKDPKVFERFQFMKYYSDRK